ncbi:MAG: hypothetical protein E7268_02515 [Lachnospiraceae bacterium]|nr:hypothetical protein [Lachnospiraceae bacterium]
MLWIWLTLLYGVIKGTREIIKKKSMEKNTILEVLFVYTLLSFLMVTPGAAQVGGVPWQDMVWIAVKSFVIFVAWIFSFKAIKKMPISLYGLLDLSRVIFSTLMGVIFLKEGMTLWQTVGLVLVCAGLLLYRYQTGGKRLFGKKNAMAEPVTKEPAEKVGFKIVCFALLSCLLNGVSGTMDKVLMQRMTSTQLQFWYMLFLVLFYLAYILITRTKIRLWSALKNYWIWILSLIFVIGDKALFIANQSADSKVTIMTLLKQAGCIVTILAGKFIFKEKNIGYKLFCAGVIITGIVLSVALK